MKIYILKCFSPGSVRSERCSRSSMLVGLELLLVERCVVLRGWVQGVQSRETCRGGGGEGGSLGSVERGRHEGGEVRVGLRPRGQTRGGEGGKTRESCLRGEGGGREVASAVQSCQT